MKKYLHNFKFLSIAFLLMLIASVANAANRFSVANGNWNATTTWSATSGGAPGASVPGAADVVTIEGFTVTVTANAATFTTLNVTTGTLIIGGFNFTVSGTTTLSGTMTINNTAGTKTFDNIVINSGGLFNSTVNEDYILTGSLAVNGTGSITSGTGSWSFGGTSTLSGTGSASITNADFTTDYTNSGNFTFADINMAGGGTVTYTNNGTTTITNTLTGEEFTQGATGVLNFSGASIGITSFVATAAGNTVNYNGAAQTIRNVTYSNLTLSGTNTKTPAGNFTVNDALTISAGATLNVSTFNLSLASATLNVNGTLDFSDTGGFIDNSTGTSVLNMGAAGLIRTTDITGLGPINNASLENNGTTFTTTSISTNGTVEYYRSSTTTQAVTDRDYNNLTINGNTVVKTWTLGAARTVNGNLVVSANAPFTLTGAFTLNVKGDWERNSTGTFSLGGTTVINLNGTSLQTIKGTQATTFNALTINNAAGVSVTTEAFVNGAMTFTNGIVNTNGSLITLNSTATIAGTPSNASHIDGPVKKLGSFVTPAFRFPVGDAGQYEYLEINGAIGTAYDFTAQYNRTSATAIDGDVVSPILNVSGCDHWVLNPGTSVPTATVTLTISWSDLNPCGGTFVTQPSTLTVGHYNGSAWDQAGTGVTSFTGTAAGGTVTRTLVSTFSPFSLANTQSGQNPLPVTFSDVKAFEKGTGVQIEWTNLTEKDVLSYTVERSANGRDFTAISQLASRSNQSDRQSYLSLDASPLAGTNYYRIKVIETDGKIVLSKIMKVDIGRNIKGISIYPNPVAGNDITIGFTAVKGQYTLRVINNAGQQVYSKQVIHPGGTVAQSVELPSSLRTGVYNLMITGDNYTETKKFIMQ